MQCLQNGSNSNVSDGLVSSINPIPTNIFWPHNHWHGTRAITLIPLHTFFWIENSYWLIQNLAHILCNLKTFKKKQKSLLKTRRYFFWLSSYINNQKPWLLLVYVILQTSALVFLCFSAYCKFQCLFCKNTLALKFIMWMFYFLLTWRD